MLTGGKSAGMFLGLCLLAVSAGCVPPSRPDVIDPNSYAAYETDENRHRPPAHLWHVLAGDVAARMKDRVEALKHPDMRIYVAPAGDTPFDHAFREMLITRLVENRVRVTNNPAAGVMVMEYKAQTVQHAALKLENLHPVLLTPLAAGLLYVVRDAYEYAGAGHATVAALLAAALWDRADEPRIVERFPSEVVVSTSLSGSDGVFVSRTTDVYFMPGHDVWFYKKPEKAVVFQVNG